MDTASVPRLVPTTRKRIPRRCPIKPAPKRFRKTDAQWKAVLSPEQYKVTRKHGTERAFTGEYWNCHKAGVYHCVCCGAPLFSSDTKFESGTGWPSFWEPLKKDSVATNVDHSLSMRRVEVHCSHCGAHLGHVFDDGPKADRAAVLHEFGGAETGREEESGGRWTLNGKAR